MEAEALSTHDWVVRRLKVIGYSKQCRVSSIPSDDPGGNDAGATRINWQTRTRSIWFALSKSFLQTGRASIFQRARKLRYFSPLGRLPFSIQLWGGTHPVVALFKLVLVPYIGAW